MQPVMTDIHGNSIVNVVAITVTVFVDKRKPNVAAATTAAI